MNEEEVKALEGLTLEEALQRIAGRGLEYRVLSEDDVTHPAITNIDPNRINFHLKAGKVVSAYLG
jgi:hypothetical protein